MIKRDDAKHRARYTLELKLEAVRLVKAGQEASVTARVLGMPKATLSNWVRACEKGVLQGAGDKPVSAEQMELARLRASQVRHHPLLFRPIDGLEAFSDQAVTRA